MRVLPFQFRSLTLLLFFLFCWPDLFYQEPVQIRADRFRDIHEILIRERTGHQAVVCRPHDLFCESAVYHAAGFFMQQAFTAVDESEPIGIGQVCDVPILLSGKLRQRRLERASRDGRRREVFFRYA